MALRLCNFPNCTNEFTAKHNSSRRYCDDHFGGTTPTSSEVEILDPDSLDMESSESLKQQLIAVKSVNRRLYGQLVSAKARSDDLVAASIEGARDAALSLGPIGPTILIPGLDYEYAEGHHLPEVAVWHLTDWQGAKRTTSYNSEVMAERVKRFWKKARSITNIQRADHPVTICYILLGGDMGEGLFNFPSQVFEIDGTIFDQFVTVSRLLVETVQFALSLYDEVHVIAEWGNHGRIGSKRDSVPRSDNFDRMIYELSRQLLKEETRLFWEDCPEDIQRVEIGAYRALLIHGDEIGRNGYASPMTIVNHVKSWKSGSYPWEFRDVYVGHYHNHAEWSLPDGKGAVYQTGSTESDNRYALVGMAASASPSQRIHFIDPVRGRVTAQYKVWLEED